MTKYISSKAQQYHGMDKRTKCFIEQIFSCNSITKNGKEKLRKKKKS